MKETNTLNLPPNYVEKQLVGEKRCGCEIPWSMEEFTKSNLPELFLDVFINIRECGPAPFRH